MQNTSNKLKDFTERYFDLWMRVENSLPKTSAYQGLPSECIVEDCNNTLTWQAITHSPYRQLDGVERALDITLQPAVHLFYGSQYAADLSAEFDGKPITLLQVWNEDDFSRLQENLIGHLVTQRRLKLSPTIFIATLDSDEEVISCCNLSGNVVLERLGKSERQILADSIANFLIKAVPTVNITT